MATMTASPPPTEAKSADGTATTQPISKREARMALGLVGADADAEAIWILAINDPNRPGKEREDLIEDLNEEGFPDRRNLTTEDLPLIEKRIQLIEELAPSAIDKVNAEAFREAYKDLRRMRDRITQR
jgi:hypothetical protein